MKRIFGILIVLIIGCNQTPKNDNSESNLVKNDTEVMEKEKPEIVELKNVWDTLHYMKRNNMKFDSTLYFRIFKENFSDIDKIYVKSIRNKIHGFYPLITLFNTYESDRPDSFRELFILDSSLNIYGNMTLDYSIYYDLFDCHSAFINDSTIKVIEEHGLSYENDSMLIKTILLRLNQSGFFDTLSVETEMKN